MRPAASSKSKTAKQYSEKHKQTNRLPKIDGFEVCHLHQYLIPQIDNHIAQNEKKQGKHRQKEQAFYRARHSSSIGCVVSEHDFVY